MLSLWFRAKPSVSHNCNDCCCAPPLVDTTSFENGYDRAQNTTDTMEKLFCSNSREERMSCRKYTFSTEFHMKPTWVSVNTQFGTMHPRWKHAFVMARVLVGSIHLSTAQYSGLTQPTKVNALSESWVAAAIFKILLKHLDLKLYELQLGQAVKPEDVAVWYDFAAGTYPELKTTTWLPGSLLVKRQLSTSPAKWIGMISVFEEQQIIIAPSILKEIHQNRIYFMQLQRIQLMTLSFPWAHHHG
jgi:hypothetical protein